MYRSIWQLRTLSEGWTQWSRRFSDIWCNEICIWIRLWLFNIFLITPSHSLILLLIIIPFFTPQFGKSWLFYFRFWFPYKHNFITPNHLLFFLTFQLWYLVWLLHFFHWGGWATSGFFLGGSFWFSSHIALNWLFFLKIDYILC